MTLQHQKTKPSVSPFHNMSTLTHTVPSLLAPYLSALQKHSLFLFTYVLGTSANWLLLRLLHTTLKSSPDKHDEPPASVILISFLRDYSFWRDAARKSVGDKLFCLKYSDTDKRAQGLDLAKPTAQNRFLCVDGLSELFTSDTAGRPGVQGDHVVLRDASLKSIESTVGDLINRMNTATPERKTVLIVDGLDFVMAANEDSAADVADIIMEWRQVSSNYVWT